MPVSEAYKKAHGFTPDQIADTILEFYKRIDTICCNIEQNLKQKGIELNCKPGCCKCCRDDLSMTQAEAAVIRKLFPNIASEKPHAEGACAFLDDQGLCRVYSARPYICRTHGLPMRWIEDDSEQRDICELNDDLLDLLELAQDECWTAGAAELQLAMMDVCTFGEQKRVDMRDFFKGQQN